MSSVARRRDAASLALRLGVLEERAREIGDEISRCHDAEDFDGAVVRRKQLQRVQACVAKLEARLAKAAPARESFDET